MESSLLTELFLPFSLAVIMFGMGLSLRLEDFRRILVYPMAVGIGLFNQLVQNRPKLRRWPRRQRRLPIVARCHTPQDAPFGSRQARRRVGFGARNRF